MFHISRRKMITGWKPGSPRNSLERLIELADRLADLSDQEYSEEMTMCIHAGDTLVCVRATALDTYLRIGQTYEVLAVCDTYKRVYIKCDSGEISHFPINGAMNEFELVRSTQ